MSDVCELCDNKWCRQCSIDSDDTPRTLTPEETAFNKVKAAREVADLYNKQLQRSQEACIKLGVCPKCGAKLEQYNIAYVTCTGESCCAMYVVV